MPTYEEKPRTVDAWKVGTMPMDAWVKALMDSGSGKQKTTPDGRKYIRLDIAGQMVLVEDGQYIIRRGTAYEVMDAQVFEALYQRTGGGK